MRETTSSEFMEWMIFLAKEEWDDKSKLDYYLAQIACVIDNFRRAFSKNAKQGEVADYLIKFKEKADGSVSADVSLERKIEDFYDTESDFIDTQNDPKWALTNELAKRSWGSFLKAGMEQMTNGGTAGN